MTDGADRMVLLRRALDQTSVVIAGIDAEQSDLPTPCRSWNVAALVDHVIHDLGQFAIAANGGKPDWAAPATRIGAADWSRAFDEGADRLLAAWSPAFDPQAVDDVPRGDLPPASVLNQQLAEFSVHAWDLIRATGQSFDLDPEVAATALAWAGQALKPEFRGIGDDESKGFGPEAPVDPGAAAPDRLAAFFGRQVG